VRCRQSYFTSIQSLPLLSVIPSHASIDAATRAARGFPEDLIRLCVGIEDVGDLIEDLERALFEAGAIAISKDQEQQRYVRTDSLSMAVERLTFNQNQTLATMKDKGQGRVGGSWFVSAPGKVILFGEHAVVHGVVRPTFLPSLRILTPALFPHLDCDCSVSGPTVL
jgi:hypothetical protein